MSWQQTIRNMGAAAWLACAAASNVACGPAAPPNAPAALATRAEAEKEVGALLDHWHLAAADAKEEAYFDALAPGAVFLGTDATERWTKEEFRAYAHPHFAKGKAWRFHAIRRSVTVSTAGDVAWFDEDLETEKLGPARGSGVAVRLENGWRIAHYDLSIPIPNDVFGEVRGVIAAHLAKPAEK